MQNICRNYANTMQHIYAKQNMPKIWRDYANKYAEIMQEIFEIYA